MPRTKAFRCELASPFMLHCSRKAPTNVKNLYDRYGSVVRIAPSELRFIASGAWKDIYGHRQGALQYQRDPAYYTLQAESDGHNLIFMDDAVYGRMRSQLSHAFSTKALEQQQPLIVGHVNLLVEKLRLRCQEGPQDVCARFNWTTFDVIGDLTLGKPFDCLKEERYHPWVSIIFDGLKGSQIANELHRYGLLNIIESLIPKTQLAKIMEGRCEMIQYTQTNIDQRLELGETDRPDFVTSCSAARKGVTQR